VLFAGVVGAAAVVVCVVEERGAVGEAVAVDVGAPVGRASVVRDAAAVGLASVGRLVVGVLWVDWVDRAEVEARCRGAWESIELRRWVLAGFGARTAAWDRCGVVARL
jgi:hypothetical protein